MEDCKTILNKATKDKTETIKETLVEIIEEQLKECKENKEVPSNGLLDTINTYNNLILR